MSNEIGKYLNTSAEEGSYVYKKLHDAGCMSGSLWFPGFKEYVFSHEMKRQSEHLYLSLGDRECKTRNPYLRMVQEQTEAIYTFYTEQGIDTAFQFNPGNHYKDAIQRTATGIAWILER